MGRSVTLGGDRINSGKRNRIEMHGYERSTHDLSTIVKTTMAAGTLVPVYNTVVLPGDTFDIKLQADVMTHPTIGPLFGHYKFELAMFIAPVRLYNPKLMVNLVNVGLEIEKIALPQMVVQAHGLLDPAQPPDNQQINPSCILSYLGIRGIGTDSTNSNTIIERRFLGMGLLMYWDTVKQYYSNKQEEIGAVIHKDVNVEEPNLLSATLKNRDWNDGEISVAGDPQPGLNVPKMWPETVITIESDNLTGNLNGGNFVVKYSLSDGIIREVTLDEIFQNILINISGDFVYASEPNAIWRLVTNMDIIEIYSTAGENTKDDTEPTITTFPLSLIDDMRKEVMQHWSDSPYLIGNTSTAPYGLIFEQQEGGGDPGHNNWSKQYGQEGLALKTYNSDLFNNWIQTEFITGAGGIAEVTAISTAGANFKLDELNLKQKVYNMLNRIAISGGTYEDWQEAVYDHSRNRSITNPAYIGGLIKKIYFQEVVSNAASGDQPLGTLAGRGRISEEQKGGEVTIKVDEPGMIMLIASITPMIEYSQGNIWHNNLKTLNDLHKPALDEIGFQDLITDQFGWWDTKVTVPSGGSVVTYQSAGKQPAWLNYMTDVNRTLGNFAIQNQQMFMTLNRQYGLTYNGASPRIADVTTYIDPVKFNNIFAYRKRDAQNFWVQVGIEITARRKMSAKVIPNL